MFYENFNGPNYCNSVISNGTLSQQASVTYVYGANGSQIPDQQTAVFPNQLTDPSQFSASNISLVDPHFRIPSILQASLQIEREILRDTVITLGTTWTHGDHQASSSAYDLNLNPPTGTTTYVLYAPGATDTNGCNWTFSRIAESGFESSDRGALQSRIRRTAQCPDQPRHEQLQHTLRAGATATPQRSGLPDCLHAFQEHHVVRL